MTSPLDLPGYEYLLRSVVAADGDRSLSTPLTRYYAEEGTPLGCESSCVCFMAQGIDGSADWR